MSTRTETKQSKSREQQEALEAGSTDSGTPVIPPPTEKEGGRIRIT